MVVGAATTSRSGRGKSPGLVPESVSSLVPFPRGTKVGSPPRFLVGVLKSLPPHGTSFVLSSSYLSLTLRPRGRRAHQPPEGTDSSLFASLFFVRRFVSGPFSQGPSPWSSVFPALHPFSTFTVPYLSSTTDLGIRP